MNKLLFVGPVEKWNPPTNGESAKNQLLLKRLLKIYQKVYVVDTQNWRKDPSCIIRMLFFLLCLRKTSVIISACDEAAYKLISALKIVRLQRNICYVVIGGGLATCIKEKGLKPSNYFYLKKIVVEGNAMKEQLEALGITNVLVVPNVKPNYELPSKPKLDNRCVRFVFLSRIEETKGCTLILNVVKRLNGQGLQTNFTVTFYGKVAPEYESFFVKTISEIKNVCYKGLLNLSSIEGYKQLQEHDVFLFPTYYFNEGFPGALVDAFISGLPIVTTNWHLNSEIVEDGKTGFIIDPHDEDALYDVMSEILANPGQLVEMAQNSRKESYKYDINAVWNKSLLHEIGI